MGDGRGDVRTPSGASSGVCVGGGEHDGGLLRRRHPPTRLQLHPEPTIAHRRRNAVLSSMLYFRKVAALEHDNNLVS